MHTRVIITVLPLQPAHVEREARRLQRHIDAAAQAYRPLSGRRGMRRGQRSLLYSSHEVLSGGELEHVCVGGVMLMEWVMS